MNSFTKLKSRYEDLYGNEPCADGTIDAVENKLGLHLPEDFRVISGFYSGGVLGGISHHEIAAEGSATNVVNETLRLRTTTNLPNEFVVIAEPPSGLIVMNVKNDKVIWCDSTDVNGLGTDSCINPDVWDSYSDFFCYLLDEEE
ncbi:SMI1/KNR4 family protein [Vibrio rotiferianus]|uniref:SMI1/KNR4 family protein n=1 Tax=Vibrio rotiferianus TaxID=190895 RepID=UPI0005774EA7|nr:SMI1/KNR4 family protein [Vibrio rotiferianus]PIB16382.1 hypothetical protein B853_11554 [Vibrio rotiferianus CAIM 577 = LMG 21460]